MNNKEQQIYTLLEKLLNEKINTLNVKIDNLSRILIGAGEGGLCNRVECLESWQTSVVSKLTVISAFLGTLFALVFHIASQFVTKYLHLK